MQFSDIFSDSRNESPEPIGEEIKHKLRRVRQRMTSDSRLSTTLTSSGQDLSTDVKHSRQDGLSRGIILLVGLQNDVQSLNIVDGAWMEGFDL